MFQRFMKTGLSIGQPTLKLEYRTEIVVRFRMFRAQCQRAQIALLSASELIAAQVKAAQAVMRFCKIRSE